MFGGVLGFQELVLLGVLFVLAVAVPVSVIAVVVYCLRRENQGRGAA